MYKTKVHLGDSRDILASYPDGYFNLIMTSPPYADARKNHYDSVTADQYPDFLMTFHDELWRVLADDGSFVLNIKDKIIDGVRDRYVWKSILRLSDAGWRCVDDYLWIKPNAMPGYWNNRLRDEWEYCFHLTKGKRFNMYQDSVRRPMGDWANARLANLNGKSAVRHNSENESGFGRDLRSWIGKNTVLPGNTIEVPLVGRNMGHPAVYPSALPAFFINLFTKEGDYILDPFAGSGTTGVAAAELGRNVVLIDNEPKYFSVMETRLSQGQVHRSYEFAIGCDGDRIHDIAQ